MALLKPLIGSTKVKLKDIDPENTSDLSHDEANSRMTKYEEELADLQTLVYAAQETPILIVLQGLDTAGKDGTIRHVAGAMNPQSCRVASFKVPTPLEMSHDFLWRVHAEAPSKGTVTIFNRSHYEDVLVTRVHKLISLDECKRRYDHINNFEKLLTDSGTVILKFFLHISNDEQKQRLIAREKDPAKSWKLSPTDWKERELWDDYQAAYEDALNHCATPDAPWYAVPANKKWFRDAAVAEAILERLRPLRDGWMKQLKQRGAAELQELRASRQSHT
jgi:PPK2 family polyphosphate:nucleotide phosphotransferase